MTQPLRNPTLNGSHSPAALLDEEDRAKEREVESRLHQLLIRELDDVALRNVTPERRHDMVERAVRTLAAEHFPSLVGDAKEETISRVVDEVVGLGPIEPLLRDPMISEVMVNGPSEVFYERDG